MDVVQIISTVGFPIFSFLACGFALKYVYDHSISEISKLTEAVSQNTLTLTKLVEKLDKSEKEK